MATTTASGTGAEWVRFRVSRVLLAVVGPLTSWFIHIEARIERWGTEARP